jgi:hypothetical protein
MLIALGGWKAIARPPQLRQTVLLQSGTIETEIDWPPDWGRPTAALLVPLQAERPDGDFFLVRDGHIVRDPSAGDLRARPQRFAQPPDPPTRLAGLPWPPEAEWALPLLMFRSNTPLFRANVRSRIDETLADAGYWSGVDDFELAFARQLNATDFEQALIQLAGTALDDGEIAEAAAKYLRQHSPIAPGLGPIRRP